MRTLLRGLAAVLLIAAFGFGAFYFLFPEQVAEAALQLERGHAGLQRKTLELPASEHSPAFHIAYLEGGPTQAAAGAPTLLLLHGIGADKDNWTRVSYFLTPHYHVVAVDLPGFGGSSKPDDASYHIDDQVRNVAAIAAALHLDRFDLGGSSMGGWISAAYAAAHPQAVSSLWLLDPAGLATAQASEMFKRIKNGERVPLFAANAEQFREVERFVFVRAPYIPGAVLNILAQRQARDYPHNLKVFAQVREDLEQRPLEAQIKDLTIPALIVWGARDRVVDVSGAEVLHRLLPNSQVSIMPNIGHLPMLEAPRASAETYLRFRESLHNLPAQAP
ncbi:MAG: alpha/beta hydrolase [Nevskia sp.]|nr:alpha/beta hydrolase [Nevskia sp.]